MVVRHSTSKFDLPDRYVSVWHGMMNIGMNVNAHIQRAKQYKKIFSSSFSAYGIDAG